MKILRKFIVLIAALAMFLFDTILGMDTLGMMLVLVSTFIFISNQKIKSSYIKKMLACLGIGILSSILFSILVLIENTLWDAYDEWVTENLLMSMAENLPSAISKFILAAILTLFLSAIVPIFFRKTVVEHDDILDA